MRYLGIMQGRLVPPEPGRFQSFPNARWRDEFALAAEAGIGAIEWIYDVYGESINPLGTDDGLAEMRELSRKAGVAVVSVCADYFMDRPIVNADSAELHELVERLNWLLERSSRFGIERIVIPFVDASRMRDTADRVRVAEVLSEVLPQAERLGVEIHLETDLGPNEFAEFLRRIEHPIVKVNYDAGNSASLGFDPVLEFAAYGQRVGSVHIKDRLRGGSTVPLGSGDANLPVVFSCLRELGYARDYVLQAARGAAGEEVQLAASNREFVLGQLREANTRAATVR